MVYTKQSLNVTALYLVGRQGQRLNGAPPPKAQLVHGIYNSRSNIARMLEPGNVQFLDRENKTSQQQHNMTCGICWRVKYLICFVVRGESPGCRLFATASVLEWLRKLIAHQSQGSSTERWSRNTLREVIARVF